MSEKKNNPNFTPGQKLAVALLVFLFILILGVFILLISGSISLPL